MHCGTFYPDIADAPDFTFPVGACRYAVSSPLADLQLAAMRGEWIPVPLFSAGRFRYMLSAGMSNTTCRTDFQGDVFDDESFASTDYPDLLAQGGSARTAHRRDYNAHRACATRILRVLEIPRSQLNDFLEMPEARQVGVYFLIGEADEAGGLPLLYIGQTGDLIGRLKEHNRSKDFWSRAFVMISLTNSLTQTHALFLEWRAIEAVGKVGRYALQNSNAGSRPHTPPLEADCRELHETAATLLATLGQPIFEALRAGAPAEGVSQPMEQDEMFYLRARKTEFAAKGCYTADGFVVLEGSRARREAVVSMRGTSNERFRERLVKEGVLALASEGHDYIFTRDHLFSSPSMAAVAVTGRSSNGWQVWRDAAGQTLGAVKRQT